MLPIAIGISQAQAASHLKNKSSSRKTSKAYLLVSISVQVLASGKCQFTTTAIMGLFLNMKRISRAIDPDGLIL
jgi:hypothetical protein